MASAFTPKLGTVHECKTSADEIKFRIWVLKGKTTRLSTSISRVLPIPRSEIGTIYESNSFSKKSEYSYLQYHWCPKVFKVTKGEDTLSIKYNKPMEGKQINKRINVGATVQNSSRDWDSSIIRLIFLLTTVLIILNPTIVIIKIKTVIAWLWKKINCSIKGELASWNLIFEEKGIFKGILFHKWILSSAH